MTDRRRSTPIKSPLSSSPPLSRNSMTITQQFAEIIRRYKYHCQHIQRILKETDKSYNDIYDTSVLTPGINNFF